MKSTTRLIRLKKNIALVAHDHCKQQLINWCKTHRSLLTPHQLYATGTTGNLIQQQTGLTITRLLSGPMGGDQQLGGLIAETKIDMLIFFWDPMNAVPHDPDVKALMRVATVWNIPIAINETSANYMIHSLLFQQEQNINIPDYQEYLTQRLK